MSGTSGGGSNGYDDDDGGGGGGDRSASVNEESVVRARKMRRTFMRDVGRKKKSIEHEVIIDLNAVEQLRLRLRQSCTTFKGLEPSKMFNKWDKNGDQELNKEELRDGIHLQHVHSG